MHLTRRHALASAAGVLLTACTSGAKPPAVVDPDDALVSAAVGRVRALLAAYDSAALATPALAPRLTPLRADCEAHLVALQASPAPTGSPTGSPTTPPATGSPTTPAVVLRDLRTLEHATAMAHADASTTASRALAATLASMAACASSHLAAL